MQIAAIDFVLAHVVQDDGYYTLWRVYISALIPDIAWLSSRHKHALPTTSSFNCYGDAGVQPPPNHDKLEKDTQKEVTHMLVAGCNKTRLSVDLRDRFRNAFLDVYQPAGCKPCDTMKKTHQGRGKDHGPAQPLRTATDDALASSNSVGSVRWKRRHTVQCLFRGGAENVPESDGPRGTPHMTGDEMVMNPDGETKEAEMQRIDSLNGTITIPNSAPSSSLSGLIDSLHTRTSLQHVVYGHERCFADFIAPLRY
ncbi:hypothetical protein DICSQDRAFT_172189 [Dichomitus squalens LYAD-421 SS1]|uniref:Uncharacterized protein n=1 Tax=Dichomitus squalens (strain LYAD-421) TaxID=732165 RepID=R7STH7_DICSQ|nr:uncharacterized protein DICSQDRAFT_172189 [Dichomitus squalens LYAD-421 SS1]EJF59203.1 hypothetical protein DICSQDRAFT_172189 [Dichomitus squalens LYAD-421 SS1]